MEWSIEENYIHPDGMNLVTYKNSYDVYGGKTLTKDQKISWHKSEIARHNENIKLYRNTNTNGITTHDTKNRKSLVSTEVKKLLFERKCHETEIKNLQRKPLF